MCPRIAVHCRPGFADRWFDRCAELAIEAKPVDGHSTSIISDLRDCSALLWHLSQDSFQELEFSRSVLFAAEAMGLTVFPNTTTAIHFDDKVAQKYLLEAAGAPLAPAWVFFSEAEALDWAAGACYPKVFKLRGGAGSANVRLVRSREQAISLIRRMFRRGISQRVSAGRQLQQGIRRAKQSASLLSVARKLPAYAWAHMKEARLSGRERGYAYFQEFVPGNLYDTRVTIIGDRGFVFRRRVRPGDFRASGSGLIEYPTPADHDLEAVQTGFEISRRLGFQCMAYDFVRDESSKSVLLLEISYVFNAEAVHQCAGHFDPRMVWHQGGVRPQDAILDDVLHVLGHKGDGSTESPVQDVTKTRSNRP